MEILLPGLISQARSQMTNKATISRGERPDKFDKSTFHQHLLNFIVTDNQVCSHLSFYVYNAYVCMFQLSSL